MNRELSTSSTAVVPPTHSGDMSSRPPKLPAPRVVLIAVGIPVALLIALALCLWLWLSVGLMPRPWSVRNTPLPPLLAATELGDLVELGRLVQAGDSIDLQVSGNANWPDGTTALVIAAKRGDSVLVQAILDHGATIGLTTAQGDSAVHWATSESLPILLKHGANINARTNHGQTPLIVAAVRARTTGDLTMVRFLIDAGADVNARDNGGRTAIGVLRTWPDPDRAIIKLLEDAGGK